LCVARGEVDDLEVGTAVKALRPDGEPVSVRRDRAAGVALDEVVEQRGRAPGAVNAVEKAPVLLGRDEQEALAVRAPGQRAVPHGASADNAVRTRPVRSDDPDLRGGLVG